MTIKGSHDADKNYVMSMTYNLDHAVFHSSFILVSALALVLLVFIEYHPNYRNQVISEINTDQIIIVSLNIYTVVT